MPLPCPSTLFERARLYMAPARGACLRDALLHFAMTRPSAPVGVSGLGAKRKRPLVFIAPTRQRLDSTRPTLSQTAQVLPQHRPILRPAPAPASLAHPLPPPSPDCSPVGRVGTSPDLRSKACVPRAPSRAIRRHPARVSASADGASARHIVQRPPRQEDCSLTFALECKYVRTHARVTRAQRTFALAQGRTVRASST